MSQNLPFDISDKFFLSYLTILNRLNELKSLPEKGKDTLESVSYITQIYSEELDALKSLLIFLLTLKGCLEKTRTAHGEFIAKVSECRMFFDEHFSLSLERYRNFSEIYVKREDHGERFSENNENFMEKLILYENKMERIESLVLMCERGKILSRRCENFLGKLDESFKNLKKKEELLLLQNNEEVRTVESSVSSIFSSVSRRIDNEISYTSGLEATAIVEGATQRIQQEIIDYFDRQEIQTIVSDLHKNLCINIVEELIQEEKEQRGEISGVVGKIIGNIEEDVAIRREFQNVWIPKIILGVDELWKEEKKRLEEYEMDSQIKNFNQYFPGIKAVIAKSLYDLKVFKGLFPDGVRKVLLMKKLQLGKEGKKDEGYKGVVRDFFERYFQKNRLLKDVVKDYIAFVNFCIRFYCGSREDDLRFRESEQEKSGDLLDKIRGEFSKVIQRFVRVDLPRALEKEFNELTYEKFLEKNPDAQTDLNAESLLDSYVGENALRIFSKYVRIATRKFQSIVSNSFSAAETRRANLPFMNIFVDLMLHSVGVKYASQIKVTMAKIGGSHLDILNSATDEELRSMLDFKKVEERKRMTRIVAAPMLKRLEIVKKWVQSKARFDFVVIDVDTVKKMEDSFLKVVAKLYSFFSKLSHVPELEFKETCGLFVGTMKNFYPATGKSQKMTLKKVKLSGSGADIFSKFKSIYSTNLLYEKRYTNIVAGYLRPIEFCYFSKVEGVNYLNVISKYFPESLGNLMNEWDKLTKNSEEMDYFLNWKKGLSLIENVVEAVQFLHDNEIMLYSLKPNNILLNENGRIHLSEFGEPPGSVGKDEIFYLDPRLHPDLKGMKKEVFGLEIDVFSIGWLLAHLNSCLTVGATNFSSFFVEEKMKEIKKYINGEVSYMMIMNVGSEYVAPFPVASCKNEDVNDILKTFHKKFESFVRKCVSLKYYERPTMNKVTREVKELNNLFDKIIQKKNEKELDEEVEIEDAIFDGMSFAEDFFQQQTEEIEGIQNFDIPPPDEGNFDLPPPEDFSGGENQLDMNIGDELDLPPPDE